jgi:mannose-6-phosphate isomerase-like protein (cupin superfamily)
MLISNLDSVEPIAGSEGTQIRQIFHPHNTMLGIRYSIVQCVIEPHKSSRPHRLKSSEVYFVVDGKGVMHVDDESAPIRKNQAVYIPPHSKQFVENTGDTPLEVLCIVDPAWRQQDEQVE